MQPTLPALLTLVTAFLVDGAPPEAPAEAGEHDLTDAALWGRILTNHDVLAGMTFDQAVNADPRRIEARIQQAVLLELYATLNAARGDTPHEQMMKQSYLLRNADIRARNDGQITAPALARANEAAWHHYAEVMRVVFEMKMPEAHMMRQAMVRNRDAIFRAFREAVEVAERAAGASAQPEDSQAWLQMATILKNMWATIEDAIVGKLGEPPQGGGTEWLEIQPVPAPAEPEGPLFGYHPAAESSRYGYHPAAEWEQHIVSGHRAPKMALPQYRRMGGRFYG